MSSESKVTSPTESRLDQVIATYLQALEAGEAPDRKELLARHLDLAAELSAFFADQDQFDRLAAPLRAMKPELKAGTKGTPTEPSPGTRVGYFGDYELLQEIARGGMGVVYKARQRGLNRLVALKMIRVLPTAGSAEVRRFQGEAEAAANLDHPNVVPIYEMGEYQRQHYFSMKLIEGGSLAGRLPEMVDDPRAAARLLAKVADAIQYAHERGILHRDLKPANILVDARGEPHVTDFGLAKRFGADSGLTQSGMIVGTPSYMAPEQACGRKGELTTAADVYSLGAILYEMLTGWPPFRGETPLGTLHQVAQQAPRPPHTINRSVSRDLETICLKCLEKDPQRRYASAGELAGDLRCYVDNKPIRARRPRWWRRPGHGPYRRKWGVALVVGVLLLFLLLALSAVRTRQVRAEMMAARAEQQAVEASRQSRNAVDAFLGQVAADRAKELPTDHKLLEQALWFYESLARDGKGVPELTQQTAEALRRIGAIHQRLGNPAKAEEAYRQAMALYETLTARIPGQSTFQADMARLYSSMAGQLRSNGKLAEAERYAQQALALQEKLVSGNPKSSDYRRDLAVTRQTLGALNQTKGRLAEAEQGYRTALAILEKLVAESPSVLEYQSLLADNYTHLGELCAAAGRRAEAEQLSQRALAIRQRLAALK
jgi:tetratricopeptide (TPR) repeat protein